MITIIPEKYQNKRILRIAFGIILALAFVSAFQEDFIRISFKPNICTYCPGPLVCENPFYRCDEYFSGHNPCITDPFDIKCLPQDIYAIWCPKIENCSDDLCAKEFIYPNKSIGKCPGWLYRNFAAVTFGITALAIISSMLMGHRK